jgi:predicted transcriptional regulator
MKPVIRREPELHRIGSLQLRILKELWRRGSASVAEVHQALGAERRLAYTTVATLLRRMDELGLVAHREEGRAFIYRALLQAEDVNRQAGRHFVEEIFEGSLLRAVSHLLQSCTASRKELAELEKAVEQAKRRAK